MRLLIVEDSEPLRRSLQHGLAHCGYAVDAVGDGKAGLNYVMSAVYDIVILDLMLPSLDGLAILRAMRHADIHTHVLILSAKDQVTDRIEGLQLGADDYLIKPFAFDELCARLKALVRRRYNDKRPFLECHGVVIDTSICEVRFDDRRIPLSPKEYAVLEVLCRHHGKVLSRAQLIEKTSDFAQEVSDNAVDVLICGLRRKLRASGASHLIHTKRGFGYFVS